MTHLLFDLDGVLVNNLRFEEAVTSYIVEQLARKRDIPLQYARQLWEETLIFHRGHPSWHDYALHCERLSLGQIWRTAHLECRDLLKKFRGVNQAIAVARRCGTLWIASDATRWVVEFKLRTVSLRDDFSELFTIDRCGSNKGCDEYWKRIRLALAPGNCRVAYVDNRRDRLQVARQVIPQCVGIWVDSPDHTWPHTFGNERVTTDDWIIRSSHRDLATAIMAAVSQ